MSEEEKEIYEIINNIVNFIDKKNSETKIKGSV